VQLNGDTGEVDVTFARSDFFTDRSPVIGHVGETQLRQINVLIAEVPVREMWFKNHESLFFNHAN